ncbi:PREDICTED: uncharacterized protein LOC106787567 [Polistes canadensis]|uniref:uncharacterized protein LOC106787567 n=1 Tax=Polistes canadensis TaxID=91411 RepID=UPI000718CF70|nr:PREDICTED: uncharacterized protein LOC106787567 [Polistes canadensis]
MSTVSFDKLIAIGRKLDEGIRELEEEWRLPGTFIGGYADVTEQTKHNIKELVKSIQDSQDDINKMIEDCKISKADPTNDSEDIFLKETQNVYNVIKKDVDNLETVFKEFGYHYNKNNDSEATETLELKEIDTKNDSNDLDNTVEVVFTPDLGWRKKKSIDKTSLLVSGNSGLLEESEILKMTASINLESKEKERAYDTDDRILLSAKKSEESLQMCSVGLTPLRNRPQCQIYSKHFYNLKKKKVNE